MTKAAVTVDTAFWETVMSESHRLGSRLKCKLPHRPAVHRLGFQSSYNHSCSERQCVFVCVHSLHITVIIP